MAGALAGLSVARDETRDPARARPAASGADASAWRHLPNAITVVRVLLVVPVGWALATGLFDLALTLFFVAAISDGVDGALARHFGWQSRFGAIADPLADKLLAATVYVLLAWRGELPLWLALLVPARDLLIIGGGLSYHLLIGDVDIAPTLLSKINTAAQSVFVFVLLASLTALPPAGFYDALVGPGIWVIATLTVTSGIDYVWTWGLRARSQRRTDS